MKRLQSDVNIWALLLYSNLNLACLVILFLFVCLFQKLEQLPSIEK